MEVDLTDIGSLSSRAAMIEQAKVWHEDWKKKQAMESPVKETVVDVEEVLEEVHKDHPLSGGAVLSPEYEESYKTREYTKEESKMAQGVDLQTIIPGMSGGDGLGGGGIVTGLILGSLLRNGGLGLDGNRTVAGIDPVLASSLGAMQTELSDIKASVPYNEGQVQLALAQAVAQLTLQANNNTQAISNQANTNTQMLQQSFATAALQSATNQDLIARDIASVDTNVDRQSTAIQIAIKDDGEKTRALITSNTIADLQRQLGVAQLTALEERGNHRSERDRISIETTVNQNQNQLQMQQQQQTNILAQMLGILGENTQIARATNQQLIIGNNGAVAAGPQNANPTNVRA